MSKIKIFLMMFFVASVMGCGTLSAVNAGSSPKSSKNGSTFISIDLNVPGEAKDYRSTARAGGIGVGNDTQAASNGNASSLAISHGKKNKTGAYADSSSFNNKTGDFATPDGRVTAEKISDNGSGQSLFGSWNGSTAVIPQVQ